MTMKSRQHRKPITGSLGLFFGGLGCIASIILLVLVWRASFWVQHTTKELTDGTLQTLEATRTRLLESETRIQTIRSGLDEIQEVLNQRIQEKLGLDEETRSKLLALAERVQTYEVEVRMGQQRSQAILIMSRETVTGLQLQLGRDRLNRLLERIIELEVLTTTALTKLERLRSTVDSIQTGLEERRDAHVEFVNGKLDELAVAIDDVLLNATDAANRSARIVEAVHKEILELRGWVLRIVFQVTAVLSFFLLWNLAAQVCLLLTGKRLLMKESSHTKTP